MAKSLKKTSIVTRPESTSQSLPLFTGYRELTKADFDKCIERVRNMTPKEMTQSLIDAGVLTKSGKKLAKRYRPRKDAAEINARYQEMMRKRFNPTS